MREIFIYQISAEVDGVPFISFFACDDDAARSPVATCQLRLRREIVVAEMGAFFVVPGARRDGVGSQLLEAVLLEAQIHGKWAVNWTVRKDNLGALSFYVKAGASIFHDDGTDYWMALEGWDFGGVDIAAPREGAR